MDILFKREGKVVYQRFKAEFENIEESKIDNLDLIVFKPKKQDLREFFEFYEKNAPDFYSLHEHFREILFGKNLLEEDYYIISALDGTKPIGYVVLTPQKSKGFIKEFGPHHLTDFCVHRNRLGKSVLIHMLLMGFWFARTELKEREVGIIVMPGTGLRVNSLKGHHRYIGNIEGLRSQGEVYNAKRFHMLYHVFEEVFERPLEVRDKYVCYIIELDKIP